MEHTNYHRFLRVSSLVCAVALLFESGLLNESTAAISQNTHSYLANVIGMSASVQPTELNLYTAELTAKERELEAREAALNEREIKVGLSSTETMPRNNDTATYILASVLFILLVLILLNYVLDYLRAREDRLTQTV